MKYFFLSTILVWLIYNSQNNNENFIEDEQEHIPIGEKTPFKLIKEDSLKKIMILDLLNGESIGKISSINFDDKSIYILEKEKGKVRVLNRKNLKYINTINEGSKKDENLIYRPMNICFEQDTLIISHSDGPVTYSYFDKEGKFFKSLENNNIFSLTNLISTQHHYFQVIESSHLKDADKKFFVYRYDKNKLGLREKKMVSSNDFNISEDRIWIFNKYIFNEKQDNAFYVSVSNSPYLNKYNYDGDLLKSIDLTTIEEIKTHFHNNEIFYDSFEGKIGHFSSLTYSDHTLVVPIDKMLDVIKLRNTKNKELIKNYLLFIDLKNYNYKLGRIDQPVQILKIIDNKLWCYNYLSKNIILYDMI